MSERIEIQVKVNGEEVPLSSISTETFNKIKDAEKEDLVYIGAIFEERYGSKWMLIYDYAANGLNLLRITKGNTNYGKTYTAQALKGECSEFAKGISEDKIRSHFYAVRDWKLIERK